MEIRRLLARRIELAWNISRTRGLYDLIDDVAAAIEGAVVGVVVDEIGVAIEGDGRRAFRERRHQRAHRRRNHLIGRFAAVFFRRRHVVIGPIGIAVVFLVDGDVDDLCGRVLDGSPYRRGRDLVAAGRRVHVVGTVRVVVGIGRGVDVDRLIARGQRGDVGPQDQPAEEGPGRIVMVPIVVVIVVPMTMIIINDVLAYVATLVHPVGAFSLTRIGAVGAFFLTRIGAVGTIVLAVASGI